MFFRTAAVTTLLTATWVSAQTAPAFDHRADMMRQLGIKALRPGADPNNQSTFSEETASRLMNTLPDALKMSDGTAVTTAPGWEARRNELVELFEREVYGRVPDNVPGVIWEVTATSQGNSGGVPTITRTLAGHVDNAAYPQLAVTIEASLTVPANASEAVPVMVAFGGFGFGPRPATNRGATSRPGNATSRPGGRAGGFPRPTGVPWTDQAIAHGWGYCTINPTSIQADGPAVDTGIIGLTNKGKPRTPEQWGALRAWAWGVSRLVDGFEQHADWKVDATKIGIEGVSRYGKAALVTEAFDPRIAVGFIASSGEGGAKLHRHLFGEAVENLTGGAWYWMAGNFMKYGSADPEKTAADLPIDSHELIALCAPRPCFISHGVVEKGDAKWIDQHGAWMATILASKVYELLGKHGVDGSQDFLTAPLPPVLKLVGGELAWRQHDGGHDATPNWPSFFEWVKDYVKAPPVHRLAMSATQPSPRTDSNSMLAHDQLVAKAKAGGVDLYFEGDSITRRWGTSDKAWAELYANWKQNFWGWNVGDFGWGADQIQNILWRLENGELDGVNPKVIVLLAGTNNVGNRPGGPEKVADITAGLTRVIEVMQEKAPNATIIVTGIFPRNDNMAVMPEINAINDNLAKLADGKRVRYLNVNDKLADAEGKLHEGMMNPQDKLHPQVKGYQVWADGLKPILEELLGPKGNDDHAPAPTGDPSATK